MSDESQAQAPAQSAPATGGQPGQAQPQTTTGDQSQHQNQGQPQNQQPNQTDTVPRDQYQRVLDQANGSREIVGVLREMGITEPAKVRQALENARKYDSLYQRGIRVDQLLEGVQQETQKQEGAQPLTEQGLNEWWGRQQQTEQHNANASKAVSGLQALQRELGGEEHQDIVAFEVREALVQHMNEHGRKYPAGHPYEGQFMPPTEQDLAQVKESAKKIMDRKRGFYMRQGVNQPQQPQNGAMGAGQRMTGDEGQNLSARDRLNAARENMRAEIAQRMNRQQTV